MLCDRGYKVADKHWGAAYWAALMPVQNWREELCLTRRVSVWCCQLKRARNITTAAARDVTEQKSDASASLAVTSTWRVHFNEGLWSCQRFLVFTSTYASILLGWEMQETATERDVFIFTLSASQLSTGSTTLWVMTVIEKIYRDINIHSLGNKKLKN